MIGTGPFWQDASRDSRREVLKDALRRTQGNITHAADKAGIARSYLTKLIEIFKLQNFAKELRLASGQNGRGRPRKKR